MKARSVLLFTPFNISLSNWLGSKNVKPDALSRCYSPTIPTLEPETIIPTSCLATALRSGIGKQDRSLVISKANSSFGRLSFQFSAANDWNKLQKSLKQETHICLTSFKHQLSEHLPIQLSHPQPVIFCCSFAPQYLYLHINLLHIYPSSV